MPPSPYVQRLRSHLGHDLILMPGVSAVVKNERGEVLMMLRSDTATWSLPAGAIDPGETPAAAVERETYEETGLRVRAERVLGVVGGDAVRVRYPNGDMTEYTVIVFACRVIGGELEARDGEASELRWFAPDAMPPHNQNAYPRELFLGDGPAQPWFQRSSHADRS